MSDPRAGSDRPSQVQGIARHGRLSKGRAWVGAIQIVAIALAVVLVATVGIASIAAYQLTSKVASSSTDIHPGETVAPPPGIGTYPGGFNILMVGSDTGFGQGGLGEGRSSALNDVNIILHVSADHKFATAISIPRDMVLPHPVCKYGGAAVGLPINTALSYGGLACVVAVVENFTGLQIQFAGLITFKGVIEISDAIGGVPVCVDGAFHDTQTNLRLKSGTTTLKGYKALMFLRSRHGVGDGSDLARISSQQVYLSSMIRKMEADDLLSDPLTTYKIANSAINNMQMSTSLDSVPTMLAIAQSLKGIPTADVELVQYPGSTGGTGIFAGKVQPNLQLGNQLIALVKADKPFKLGTSGANRGSVVKGSDSGGGSKTTINGLIGQSASQESCSKSRPVIDQ